MAEASSSLAAPAAPLGSSPSLTRSLSKPGSGGGGGGGGGPAARTYSLRPCFQHKFRSSIVKDCIHEVLKEMLTNVQYIPEEIPPLTKLLSETIRDRLKEKGFHRYKIMVQVVIGEQRGEGVNMAARCFWDADTDNYAQDVFMNDSLFCVAVAFGCFFY